MRFIKIRNDARKHECEDCGSASGQTIWLLIFAYSTGAVPICVSCIQRFQKAIRTRVKDVTWQEP